MKALMIFILLLTAMPSPAQTRSTADTLHLTLADILMLAKEKSIASRQAGARRATKYWEWRSYRANFKPQLFLNGSIPAYSRTYQQVLQPDGSILFQPVFYNNSTVNISFSQSIAATGGTIFGTTELQRFDNFDTKKAFYNAVPFAIGYTQPICQFNGMKWDKRIEPLKYNESKQAYLEGMEQVSITATQYFFDLLMAQVNLQIAETNLANTEKILAIANVKLDIGKISKNEMLQLQLEQLKARKAVGQARRDMQIAALNLNSFTGMSDTEVIRLEIPPAGNKVLINVDQVLKEALANRSDAVAFVRRLMEARRDVEKARTSNGLNASLTARLGFSNSAATFGKSYQSPKQQQMLQIDLTIPILDWGRSKARIKTAEENQQLTQYEVEKDKQVFVQQIVTQVSLYDMMKDQLLLTAEADSIANEKYIIAQERYVLGNLSITDLSIAFAEKDQAKRDYISALRDFWGAYYQIRFLSLYDFEKNKKIIVP